MESAKAQNVSADSEAIRPSPIFPACGGGKGMGVSICRSRSSQSQKRKRGPAPRFRTPATTLYSDNYRCLSSEDGSLVPSGRRFPQITDPPATFSSSSTFSSRMLLSSIAVPSFAHPTLSSKLCPRNQSGFASQQLAVPEQASGRTFGTTCEAPCGSSPTAVASHTRREQHAAVNHISNLRQATLRTRNTKRPSYPQALKC